MQKRELAFEDLFAIRWVSEPQISPQGTHVAYVQREIAQQSNTYRSHLWLARVEADPRVPACQLTIGDHRDMLPRWAPDGRTIAFLSNRSATGQPGVWQIYLLSLGSGGIRALATGSLNPDDLAWSPDGRTIAFVGRVPAAPHPSVAPLLNAMRPTRRVSNVKVLTRLPYRSDLEGFWDGACRQIFTIPGGGGEPHQLTEGDYDHREPTWSPDGKLIAFVANDTPDGDSTQVRDLWVVSAQGGFPRRLTGSRGPCASPAWSPDGALLAYFGHDHAYGSATSTSLWLAHLDGTPPRNLTASFDRPFSYHVNSDMRELTPKRGRPAWSQDGKTVLAPFEDGGTHRLAEVDCSSGDVRPLTSARREIFAYSFDRTRTRGVIAAADPVTPGDLWSVALDDGGSLSERRITAVNHSLLDEVELSCPERFTFDSDDVEIEGWVLPPLHINEGEKYPAILQIHGGPHSSYGETFFYEWQVMAAHGIATIYTNPRGSQGYGQAFSAAIRHGWGERDYDDLMRAVDVVVERFGYVDGTRLGVAGGSYGGFMTNWVISHTDRFRAAVSERCVSNLASHSTTTDMPLLEGGWSFPGDPWENPAWYWRHSPLAHIGSVRTPLLLVHGEEDFRCTVAEAEQFFGALKRQGRVVVLLCFPEENHDLTRTGKPAHRLERMRWVVSWLRCHLLPPTA